MVHRDTPHWILFAPVALSIKVVHVLIHRSKRNFAELKSRKCLKRYKQD